MVAPYTGAWIEILQAIQKVKDWGVAPYTGAWIEIRTVLMSAISCLVAPYTGAWIEISDNCPTHGCARRRSLHGSVD